MNEGPKEVISSALVAAMLAIPGLLPAAEVQKEIVNNDSAAEVCMAVNKKVRMIGDYTAFQVANIVARTLYAEARNDGKDNGFMPVASVIYNRANGNKELFAKVCLKKYQFSCWNKFTDEEAKPDKFQIKIPTSVKNNKKNQKLWQQCMEIAANMLASENSFTPCTNANMYYATKKSNLKWAKQLKNSKQIGSHTFGYLKNHSKFY